MNTFWQGVLPAITTPFLPNGEVDHAFLARHVNLMIEEGSTGIVPLGKIGRASCRERV